jgi:hypothetical protein
MSARSRGYRPVFDRMCIEFVLAETLPEMINRVSYAVLQDVYGADADDSCLNAFEMHRGELEGLAGQAITVGQVNETGGANITTDWLRSLRRT